MSEAQGKLLQGEMNMTLNMTIMTSARDAVGKCLATLGGEYDNMLVLTADVDTSSRIQAFKEKYPDRCYNVGIAEQNLMSVSAGLAHEGFRPLAFAFAPFASLVAVAATNRCAPISAIPSCRSSSSATAQAIPTALPAARTARWRTPRSWSPATT